MPNVQIRDVPEQVHAALVRRAHAAGKSLQQYLSGELVRLATTPTLDEVLDRLEAQASGSLTTREATSALADERARR